MTLTAMQKEVIENKICSSVGKTLEDHYAGWSWWVECKLDSGCVNVRNTTLDGDYGFIIPLSNLLNETDGDRIIMRAGGEILERYNMHRSVRKEYDITRDFKGSAAGDIE